MLAFSLVYRYSLLISGAVTTGGRVYRVREGGPVTSPSGGSSVRNGANVVGTERALSARVLSEEASLGDEPPLLRRKRVWIGEIGC